MQISYIGSLKFTHSMTRKKFVIYQIFISAVILGIGGSIVDFIVEGAFELSSIVKWTIVGGFVNPAVLGIQSMHICQISTEEVDAVGEELGRLGYKTMSDDIPDKNLSKQYYYKRINFLMWDEAIIDVHHHYIEFRGSYRMKRRIAKYLVTL